MAGAPFQRGRRLLTPEQLRSLREQRSEPDVTHIVRRRAEDRIREERHDALAKSICAGHYAEPRRYRSPSEFWAQPDDDEHRRWVRQQRPARKKCR